MPHVKKKSPSPERRTTKVAPKVSLTERLLAELKGLSKNQKIRKRGKYTAGYAVFDVGDFNTALERVNHVLEPILKNGEKILSDISAGEIVDSGIKQFRILKGTFMEIYDYTLTSATFIRLYHITDEKREWAALYIDENPSTAWWGE